ncbi:MAG: biotin--[acetyl-CoA-carboxylase] ligase [Planctomycetota bacterium]|nr:MAG: biotin--[acetyl-CoA-carboxylase] ligase [Planctomycetota bacterium]
MALAEATKPDADGFVVLADYQTAGRGRQGQSWLSPRGASVLCSVLLIRTDPNSPEAKMSIGGRLTLIAAVASCEAIRQAADLTPTLKWPNDLRISGRKLGGILVESRPISDMRRAWVIGIGINCLQHDGHFEPEIQDTAISLEQAASHGVDRVIVARELLRSLDRWLTEPLPDDDKIHTKWLHYADPIGQRVHLSKGGQEYVGRTVDIDPGGGLIVQLDDGRQEWFDPMITTLL